MFLKLSKFLEKLAFKLRQRALYFEFKHYIENDESYIKNTHYFERCIGKTYTLIQLAYRYRSPIIVSTECMGRYIERLSQEINRPVEVIPCHDERRIRGSRFRLVLLEEGVKEEIVEYLKSHTKQIIGFRYID